MAEIRGVVGTGRRESFTFRPDSANELIRIYKIDGCVGDTKLTDIQVEAGNEATSYVAPHINKTEASGLFKGLRDIRVEIEDESSETWSKIRANSEAGLIEYHKGNLMSSLGISPEQHIQAFEDKISGDYATFEQRLNGMQTNIRNGADEYTDTELAKLRQTEIKNLDGRVSTATQTLDAYETRLESAEGAISNNTQTIEGFNRSVSDLNGRLTSVSESIDGIRTTIKDEANRYTDTKVADMQQTVIENIDGRISTVNQNLDQYSVRLRNTEGTISSHTQTLKGFQNKLEDAEGNISNNTQLINGFNRRVEDVDGRLTQVSETIDGVETKIVNRANQYTDTKLADLRRTELKDIEGNVSSMEQSIENFRQTLRTASGDVSQVEQTIREIREEFQSADRELEARFERTLEGAETRIKNSAHSYTDTELASMRETLIESVDGEVSKVTQSLDRYESRLADAEGSISSNTQLINGFNREVSNVDDRITRVAETIDGVRTTVRDEANRYTDTELATLRQTEIQNIQGAVSTMEQSIENFRQTLQSASGDVSQVEQTINGLREEFKSADRTLESRFNRTLSGAETRIITTASRFIETELANLRESEISNIDGRLSRAEQTVDNFGTTILNLQGDVSESVQTLGQFRRELRDVGGRLSLINETVDGIKTTVKNEASELVEWKLADMRSSIITSVNGKVSQMEQTLNNFRATLTAPNGQVSDVEQTLSGLRAEFKRAEDNLEARFNRTINGAETRIKRDSKEYIQTQIAELQQTLITDGGGNSSSDTQTIEGFNRTIQTLRGSINTNRSNISGNERRISDVDGRVTTVSESLDGLRTTVTGLGGLSSQITQLQSQISSKVSSSDFESLIQQNKDAVWLAVRDKTGNSSGGSRTMTGSEIISAIRLDRSGVKISGSKIQITGDTSIDNAVIKSGHIHSLNADKITTGTLNAARVRVINLDANNITGNKTNFVQSNWNNINDRVQITSAGIEMINSGAWRKTIYTATGLEMFRGRGAGDNAGVIGYFKGSDYHANDEEYFMDGFGDHHTIGIGAYGQIALGTGNDTSIRKFEPKMVINQKYDGIQTNKIAALKTEAGFTISAGTARGEWASIIGGSLNGRNRLTFAQSIATLEANDKLDFYASAGARVMRLTYKSVDINGSIKYSSDARLKTNIQKSKQNSLSQIMNIEYTTFDWKDGSKNQFGFIAQQVQQSASELITTDSEDYLRYDETRYVHTIGHALQQSHEQLLERIENLEEENELLKEKLNEAV